MSDKRRVVSVNLRLRNKIIRFFRDNPEETLTLDDMELKFSGNGTSTFLLEDVVAELVADNLLIFKGGVYAVTEEALAPQKRKKVPKESAVDKAVRLLNTFGEGIDPDKVLPLKRKKPRGWTPNSLRRKRSFLAPYWMRENAREPFNRYRGPPLQGVDSVREFWNKANAKESCELWVNTGTGEKTLTSLHARKDDCWLPLMRSEAGKVGFATHSYTFAAQRC